MTITDPAMGAVNGKPAVGWFFLAVVIWVGSLVSIEVGAIAYLVIGGPIAFYIGFVFFVIRKVLRTMGQK